ncbi:MAG: hypothetical protein ACR2NF_11685, partial [Pirellulales bacterium]
RFVFSRLYVTTRFGSVILCRRVLSALFRRDVDRDKNVGLKKRQVRLADKVLGYVSRRTPVK